jgi:hypothetical protein
LDIGIKITYFLATLYTTNAYSPILKTFNDLSLSFPIFNLFLQFIKPRILVLYTFSDTEALHENLADLTCSISIKQKLIEELEMSQKRLHSMKVQYEEKMVALQEKINVTETERDKALTKMGGSP